MTNELLARIALLEEENQRLKERIHDLLKENTEWKFENERLNNVLNELEEWLKERSGDISFAYKHTLNKLNELKESDK